MACLRGGSECLQLQCSTSCIEEPRLPGPMSEEIKSTKRIFSDTAARMCGMSSHCEASQVGYNRMKKVSAARSRRPTHQCRRKKAQGKDNRKTRRKARRFTIERSTSRGDKMGLHSPPCHSDPPLIENSRVSGLITWRWWCRLAR